MSQAPDTTAKPARAKRWWQVTNKFGDALDGERLDGASPRKAALKAVTRYAPNDGETVQLYLREMGHRGVSSKGLPPGAKSFKLHVYQGHKERLLPHEVSSFTQDKAKIEFKPVATSLGVDVLTVQKVAKMEVSPSE